MNAMDHAGPELEEETTVSAKRAAQQEPWLEVIGSRYLLDWLAEQRISLAFSTYQTGKLFLLGRKTDGRLSVFERTFTHCMGLWGSPDARSLWISSRYQLWRFENPLTADQPYDGFDACYIPRIGYTTAHLDTHDIAVEASGRVLFVNTLFSCLATISDRASFRPVWRPPFVRELAPEDRCHLNGLALREGRAKYVTAVAETDGPEGWRDRRADGGCVLDVESGEVIVRGLSMPHSPRWYRDQLWLLNSGTGELGYVDPQRGAFQPLAFCPGYLRGLAFAGDLAIVTLSLPRQRTFEGLPLDQRLAQRGAEAQCGLHIIDLRSGQVVHTIRLEGLVTEMYDVVVLPEVTRPMAVGFKTDEIERMIQVDEEGRL